MRRCCHNTEKMTEHFHCRIMLRAREAIILRISTEMYNIRDSEHKMERKIYCHKGNNSNSSILWGKTVTVNKLMGDSLNHVTFT